MTATIETISFACNHCSRKLRVKASKGGQALNCPACNGDVLAPSPHPAQQQVIVVESISSNLIATIVGLFLPSIGYLVQSRWKAFLGFWATFLASACLFAATIETPLPATFVVLPVMWIISVINTAKYKPTNRSA